MKLDVTNPADAATAVEAAITRFGQIDVLVNNAASFHAGFFEELSSEQMQAQLATSLFGPMNVTRAVLPSDAQAAFRADRHHIVECRIPWLCLRLRLCRLQIRRRRVVESVQAEVEPFGIEAMIINPGFFRTELLTPESTDYADAAIADYDAARGQQIEFWKGYNGKQSGDPAKLAEALLTLTALPHLPSRFIAGADAIASAEQKVATLQEQIDAHRELSTSLAFHPDPDGID